MDTIGRKDLVAFVIVKSLITWMFVSIEDTEFHKRKRLRKSKARVRQECLGQVAEHILAQVAVERRQHEGRGSSSARTNLKDAVELFEPPFFMQRREAGCTDLVQHLRLYIILISCCRARKGQTTSTVTHGCQLLRLTDYRSQRLECRHLLTRADGPARAAMDLEP
jgi:hypothetical protein